MYNVFFVTFIKSILLFACVMYSLVFKTLQMTWVVVLVGVSV